MAIISDGLIQTTKKAADVLGKISEARKVLLQVFNPANKNVFELLLYPQNFPTSVTGVALASLDTALASLYIQSIQVSFFSLEYTQFGHQKSVTELQFPEEVTFTFLENETGFVRSYVNKWIKETVFYDFMGDSGYIFEDNQDAAKKTAIIIPQSGLGIPSLAWIRMSGLRFKSLGELTFGQAEGDPMFLDVTCACDQIWISTPF